MKRIGLAALAALAVLACQKTEDFAAYVNPLIGTGGHGHVFVGANVPFGAVQLGPTSMPQQWDWCSGYHESDSTVIGFSHTHLSGTGIGDLFDVTLMPVAGEVEYRRGLPSAGSGELSYALRGREVAEPGYYSVPLSRWGVLAEMTATCRVGLHRYTFTADDAALVIDLENGGCWDDVTLSGFTPELDADGKVAAVSGYRFSTGWARDQKLFFRLVPDRPAESFEVFENKHGDSERGVARKALYGKLSFGAVDGPLMVKVAVSPVSEDGAAADMEAELPGWDFDAVRKAARRAWNSELSKVKLRTADETARTVFYTALYHTMVAPSVFCDVDGSYRGADGGVHCGDFTNYTTFSLWDTYRAAMPLMTVLHPEKMDDIAATMFHIFEQQGKFPVWHLHGNETDCMVGNPGHVAFADAIVKGYGDAYRDRALDALVASSSLGERGQDLRRKYGYIPCDLYNESVANDMEYAIADGAVANLARALGNAEVAEEFTRRSRSYRNYFDPSTGFMRAKLSDGNFKSPFNPFFSNHMDQDYTEGTAWQYIWLVPQDVDGLVECFGSREKTVSKLDSLFLVSSEVEGDNASPDISGLIGQYAHGNEPGHHTLYLYSMLGEPWKAADRIRQVCSEMYTDSREGLAGNEDVGQMSAWYVLSALGFYQVEPACPRFWFGAPLFPSAELRVPGGKLTVKAAGLSAENRYIRSVSLNGRPLGRGYMTFDEIMAGGELRFVMGPDKTLWY